MPACEAALHHVVLNMPGRYLRAGLGAAALLVAGLALLISVGGRGGRVPSLASEPPPPGEERFTGSSGCRDCHEKFYELWAGSLHGLAMQPFTAEFARQNLSPQAQGLEIGGSRYRYALQDGAGLVVGAEPGREKRYPIDHVLGGKNVF